MSEQSPGRAADPGGGADGDADGPGADESGDGDEAADPDGDTGTTGEPVAPAVRDAFVDAAPRTVAEVAVAADAPRDAVADALADLEAAGELRRREVAATGDDGAARTAVVWHLPASTLRERTPEGTVEAGDAVDRAVARMAFPGASRMMRDWRRDAVRAVVAFLREDGPATADGIVGAVYPPHSAGYDDRDAWWDCVRPRLLAVPGVAHDDGEWRYDP
ncbi:hypothetical protein [Halostella litorea]|uniref:hypothetical protein n=1 Tax=Halostella litorea TaxID=2528831 RepID=UPI0010933468|nr:hypothetical protein [Halostella litorea]